MCGCDHVREIAALFGETSNNYMRLRGSFRMQTYQFYRRRPRIGDWFGIQVLFSPRKIN